MRVRAVMYNEVSDMRILNHVEFLTKNVVQVWRRFCRFGGSRPKIQSDTVQLHNYVAATICNTNINETLKDCH